MTDAAKRYEACADAYNAHEYVAADRECDSSRPSCRPADDVRAAMAVRRGARGLQGLGEGSQ